MSLLFSYVKKHQLRFVNQDIFTWKKIIDFQGSIPTQVEIL